MARRCGVSFGVSWAAANQHVEHLQPRRGRKTMDLKRVASAAAIAAGVGISTLMFGMGPVNAAPMPNPSPAPTIPRAPGGPGMSPGMSMAPTTGAVPHSGGGGPHSGGGSMTETTKTP